MNLRVKKLLLKFKPEFGNEKHILALEIIGKIRKRDALIQKKRDKSNEWREAIKELDTELNQEEKQLEFLLK